MGRAVGFLKAPVKRLRQEWRERGWVRASASEYLEAFNRLGGSIHVHPLVISTLSLVFGKKPRFLVKKIDGRVVAAIPMLGNAIGGTRESLVASGLHDAIDIGDSEVILPLERGLMEFRIPCSVSMISAVHLGEIAGLKQQANVSHMLALHHGGGDDSLSSRTLSGHRRKVRRFLESGGQVQPVVELSPQELADTYIELFHLRWGRKPQGWRDLVRVVNILRPLLRGFVLLMNGKPVAVQIILAHPTPRGLLGVYVNGGVDPTQQELSPGSILYFLNVQQLHRESLAVGIPMRYAFGRNDHAYKQTWCHWEQAYKVG